MRGTGKDGQVRHTEGRKRPSTGEDGEPLVGAGQGPRWGLGRDPGQLGAEAGDWNRMGRRQGRRALWAWPEHWVWRLRCGGLFISLGNHASSAKMRCDSVWKWETRHCAEALALWDVLRGLEGSWWE